MTEAATRPVPDYARAVALALQHLSQADPIMAGLIKRFGPYTVVPHDNLYHELVSSIIGQQLSVKAAAAIERRFVELFGGNMPEPQQILATTPEVLRTAGLSGAKAAYTRDLAQHIIDGDLDMRAMSRLSNTEIIRELTAVKGIGEWTAHMFLIFAVGRLNVLPVGDLGVRTGIQRLYSLAALPSPKECEAVAAAHSWAPYQSVAAWYIWKSLDNV